MSYRCLLRIFATLTFVGLVALSTAAVGLADVPILAARTPIAFSLPATSTVGAPLLLQAQLIGISGAAYRFEIDDGLGDPLIVRDFATHDAELRWTPIDEGTYAIIVQARASADAPVTTVRLFHTVTSRLGTRAEELTPTSHPLVLLYSKAPCGAGKLRVTYTGDDVSRTTPWVPCSQIHSSNLLIGGLLAKTRYSVRSEVLTASGVSYGPTLTAFTGAVPASIVPVVKTLYGNLPGDMKNSAILYSFVQHYTDQPVSQLKDVPTPTAIDANGRVVWYYDAENGLPGPLARPTKDGTFFMFPTAEEAGLRGQILREINLLGETVGETNALSISQQLAGRGEDPVTSLHHDALRLPNGSTAVLASTERLIPDPATGQLTGVEGDEIIVLDRRMHVTWAWNEFDFMDPSKYPPTLHDSCMTRLWGCRVPADFKGNFIDWSHANALSYAPDGNFLISFRALDLIVKINYNNGAGDGRLLWRLGTGGDFALVPKDGDLWFSHQHGPAIFGNRIAVFDNGNVRKSADASANSRLQVYEYDDLAHVATVVLSSDLEAYGERFGNAQQLENCRYAFLSGETDVGGDRFTLFDESGDPQKLWEQEAMTPAYRGFFLNGDLTLWPGPKPGVQCGRQAIEPTVPPTAFNDPGTNIATYGWHKRPYVAGNSVVSVGSDNGEGYTIDYAGGRNLWVETTRSTEYASGDRVAVKTTAPNGTVWYLGLFCKNDNNYTFSATQAGDVVTFTLDKLPGQTQCSYSEFGLTLPVESAIKGEIQIENVETSR
jgi:arylsulfate sulfotransferase